MLNCFNLMLRNRQICSEGPYPNQTELKRQSAGNDRWDLSRLGAPYMVLIDVECSNVPHDPNGIVSHTSLMSRV